MATGWCAHIPSLLSVPEHDSREKVLVAMDTVLPACHATFQDTVPALRSLKKEYTDLLLQEQFEEDEEEEDGYYQGLITTAEGLLAKLTVKEEL